MSILLLSEPNLRVLKNVLMKDYEVRSSHASELIAALSGFKSYAALKSQIGALPFVPAVEINTKRFEDRSVELGYDRGSAEWMHFSFLGLALPDRPWLLHSTVEKHLRDNKFSYCEQRSIPYITIHKKRKYCHFQWDCVTIEKPYDKHARGHDSDELSDLLFRLYKLTARGEEPKSTFKGKAFIGEITNISEYAARQLANEFFMQLTPWRFNC